MASKDAIRVEGWITEVLPKWLFWVELANGHRLMAHVGRQDRGLAEKLAVGDKVVMDVSPFDLSRGCITGNAE